MSDHAILEKLAADISQHTAALSSKLKADNPNLSLDEISQWNNAEFSASRIALITTCRELLEVAIGPIDRIKDEIPMEIQFHSAMSVISHFNIAQKVPEPGEISYEDLAEKTGIQVERLRRILRCAIGNSVFREANAGYIRHTSTSKVLLQNGARAWLGHHLDEMLPAAGKMVEFLEQYPTSESSKETAMSLAFPPFEKPKSYWEIVERTPGRVQRFSDGLEYATGTGGHHDFHDLVNVFDWKKYGDAKLVDVGGSSGRVAAAIAELAPDMTFVVQDLPEVQEAFDDFMPKELTGRIRFEAHDFFEAEKITDAKVYLYRQILHDWPDAEAILILKALVPALRDGDVILLCEAVFPEPGTLPKPIERLVRSADLLMMAKHNAKERTLPMWQDLIAKADTRFQYKAITFSHDMPSAGTFIELVWNGESSTK